MEFSKNKNHRGGPRGYNMSKYSMSLRMAAMAFFCCFSPCQVPLMQFAGVDYYGRKVYYGTQLTAECHERIRAG